MSGNGRSKRVHSRIQGAGDKAIERGWNQASRGGIGYPQKHIGDVGIQGEKGRNRPRCGQSNTGNCVNACCRKSGASQAVKGTGKRDQATKRAERIPGGSLRFFRSEPSEVGKNERLKYIAQKTEDGSDKGKISFYCKALNVSRQAFYDHLKNRDKPWKHAYLAELINSVTAEDECNDTYGRKRMHSALKLKYPNEKIPSERTVYRVMEQLGANHTPRRKPNGITKADREAMKSDDLLKRDFTAEKPCEKCVTDITEIPAKDGKLYVSAIFDCYDAMVLGLAMADNMRAELCVRTLEEACKGYRDLRGAVIHSDRGSQYTSGKYRTAVAEFGIRQSMNSAGGRCHDNARCESMWARMKEELFYSRKRKSEDHTAEELKTMIWRYFMSYWNNRRICSAIGGIPPAEKRRRYYTALTAAA